MNFIRLTLLFIAFALSSCLSGQATLLSKHRSGYLQLTFDTWDAVAFQLIKNNPRLPARRVISFLEGLEIRLAANQMERPDGLKKVRAAVLGEMTSLSWNGTDRLELIAYATEFAAKRMGDDAHLITQFLIKPASEGVADLELYSQAFISAKERAGSGNSYLTIFYPEAPGFPAYGVTLGNKPQLKGSFYIRSVAQAPRKGGPIQETSDSDGLITNSDSENALDLALFDEFFSGKSERGWAHSFIPQLMERFLINSYDALEVDEEVVVAKGIVDAARRVGRSEGSTLLSFLKEMRKRELGDLTADITDVRQLQSFLEASVETAPIDGDVFRKVSQHRRERERPLFPHLGIIFDLAGDSLQDLCDRLIADADPDSRPRKPDIEPGSDD